MSEEIIITFDDAGAAKVEAVGVRGRGCKALTAPFEAALGLAGESVAKPEMLQQPIATAIKVGTR